MKQNKLRKLISFVLTVVLVFTLAGCGNKEVYVEEEIKLLPVDENGIVSWEPVEGAVKYQIDFLYIHPVDHNLSIATSTEITDTYIQLPPGFAVDITPVFADGSVGDRMTSETFGEYSFETDPWMGEGYGVVYERPEDDLPNLSQWEFVQTLDASSCQKTDDGHVYFEGKGPSGETVRFYGFDMELTDKGILMHKNGWLTSMDSIGRVSTVDLKVDEGNPDDWISVFAGFSFDCGMHPSDIDDMCFSNGCNNTLSFYQDEHMPISVLYEYESYFWGTGTQAPHYRVGDYTFTQDVMINSMNVYYKPTDECKPFRKLLLPDSTYGAYIEGEKYDSSREVFDPYNNRMTFALYAFSDLDNDKYEQSEAHMKAIPESSGILLEPGDYTIGDVKDANGKVLDKENDILPVGSTLTINVGGRDYDVDLHVLTKYNGAKTMHDLVPNAYPSGVGQRNALVIPIAWPDQPESSTQEVYDRFKSELGRVAELGVETAPVDYSDNTPDGRYSLTGYFDTVSYGKFHLDNYMTEWYNYPAGFAEMHGSLFNETAIEEMEDWLFSTYPDVDWTQFDLDANGYIDTVIMLNAGVTDGSEGYITQSFEGAIQYRHTYGDEYAGTPDRPSIINNIVTVNAEQLCDNALLHEFSHSFGLIDYYDVSYSGVDAVGGYDMQSSSVGDWNPYSKYAVGWIEPTVVSGLNPGESVDIEIGAFADTGDAIVIPYAGEDVEPPFSEYIMVDLLTDTGVNPSFTGKAGLSGVCGVRMYHVDAVMERRDYVDYSFPDMNPCPIGTVHYANNYKTTGKYNLEIIQAGAVNTFTNRDNLRTNLQKNDLFKVGDKFTMSRYSQFFDNGLMDYGDDFGYSISVVSINGSGSDAKAVIRVTRE